MNADWIAVAVAAVAAGVAVWQAIVAQLARRDAQRASRGAQEHEAAALLASESAAASAARSAAAQERLAEAVEGQTIRPTWKLRKKSPTLWHIQNVSGHEVHWVTPLVDDDRLQVVGDTGDGFDSIGPREGFDLVFDYRLGQPPYASLQLLWPDHRGEQQAEQFTVEWRPPSAGFVG